MRVARYYLAIDSVSHPFRRRTIYRWQTRGRRSPLLETFHCPDPLTKTPKWNITTAPGQTLGQWNDPFVLRMSQRLAERVKREAETEVADQVIRIWQRVLARHPDDEEMATAVALMEENGLSLLARFLFNNNAM